MNASDDPEQSLLQSFRSYPEEKEIRKMTTVIPDTTSNSSKEFPQREFRESQLEEDKKGSEIKIQKNATNDTKIFLNKSQSLHETLKVISDAVTAVRKCEEMINSLESQFNNLGENVADNISVYLGTAYQCLSQASVEFRKLVSHVLQLDNMKTEEQDQEDAEGDRDDETYKDDKCSDEEESDLQLKTELDETTDEKKKETGIKIKLKCDECDHEAKSKYSLKKHMKLKHGDLAIDFKQQANLQNEDEKLTYTCSLCEYITTVHINFKQHIRNKHSEETFSCSQCQYFSRNAKELKHHIAVHHEGLRFSCDKCDYSAKYMNNLKEHTISKHLGITYSCDICGFTVKQKRNLKKHRDKHHPSSSQQNQGKEEVHYCDQCMQSFTTTRGLDRHVKDVHLLKRVGPDTSTSLNKKLKGEENLKCEDCGHLASSLSSLKMHMNKHSGTRVFCDQCDYSTHNKYSFKVHQHQHTGEIFYCDQCGYKTHTRLNLKRHVDSKHSKQNYTCDQCTFTSPSRAYLSNHIKKQHQEKKYECDRCNFSAVYPSDLKSHISAIHDKIRFICDVCDFSAPYKGDLNRHRKTVHSLPPTSGQTR